MRLPAPATLLACLLAAGACPGWAAQTVRVGAVIFPPYIEQVGSGEKAALHIELLDLMNAFQDEYHFELVATGTVRRFQDFDLGKYDLSMFDNLAWGWGKRAVDASRVYLGGGELYIAHEAPGRDDHYFDNFEGKRIIGMRGYHYGFANFNADGNFLRTHFNMVLTDDNEATIRSLLMGRGEIAVVTSAFLSSYLLQHPELASELLVSKRRDQSYAHTIIVRRGAHPSAAEINALLDRMQKAGTLAPLWKKYGVDPKTGLDLP
jgi:ABC-type amino acid transport substrate-binding protein